MIKTKLIAALRAAKEPSRELDAYIAEAAGITLGQLGHSLPYTSSIDAALTLVPEGWRIYLERKPTTPGAWFCAVREHAKDGWTADSDVAAIAICIAALEATP